MANNVLKFEPNGISTSEMSGVGYDSALVDRIVTAMEKVGIKKNADIINYEAAYNFRRAGKRVPEFLSDISMSTLKQARESRTFNFGSEKQEFNFTTSGSPFFINDFTLAIIGVFQEVYDTSADTALTDVFPSAAAIERRLAVSIFAAPGGLADPYNYGTSAKEIAKIGNRTQFYSGIPYRNYMTVGEEEGTFWYEVGNPNLSARGLLQRLTMYALQANVVMNNRINLIRASVFNNGISYFSPSDPMTTVNYQIPVWNFVTSITDPVNGWGTIYQPSNYVDYNPNANPIVDLIYLFNQAPALISRLNRMRRVRMIMSPLTRSLFILNPNVQSKVVIVQGAPGSAVDARNQYGMDFLIKSQIPGLENVDILVDGSGYLATNSDVTWLPDGSGFVNNVNGYVPYNYFIPPGQILFVIDVEDKGGKLGEFVFTSGVQNGGFQQATAKPWFVVEDLSVSGSRGGPANPSLQLNFGFAGMLAVYHPEAVIIGNFGKVVNGPPPAQSQFKSFVLPSDSHGFNTLTQEGDKFTESSFAVEGGKEVLKDSKKISKGEFNEKMNGEK